MADTVALRMEELDRLQVMTRIAAPTTDMAGEVSDATVEILDRVRRTQRAVERTGDAEPLKREDFVEALTRGRGDAPVRSLQAGGELLEAAPGQRRVLEVVGVLAPL